MNPITTADMAPPTPTIDPTQTRQVQEFKHTSPLLGCRFDATGEFVFAGAQDNTVQRWHLATGKKTALTGHKSWLRGLACTKDKLLFTGGYDGKILTWLAGYDHPTPANTFDAHNGWVRALAVSPDGKLLASCGNDNLVKLWSTGEGKLVRELPGHDSHVYNVAFHPGGQFLASADLKGTIKVWDVAKGVCERDLDVKILHKYDTGFRADHGGARGMAFNADGTALAVCGITDVSNAFAGVGNPLVVQFDWQTGKQKLLQRPREAFQGTMWAVAFHPACFVVAVAAGNGGVLYCWKPDQDKDFFALKLPNNARDLNLHPDSRRLAVAFADGAIRVYDMGPKA
jgi:WD40 repeat protein